MVEHCRIVSTNPSTDSRAKISSYTLISSAWTSGILPVAPRYYTFLATKCKLAQPHLKRLLRQFSNSVLRLRTGIESLAPKTKIQVARASSPYPS